jgi:hypothetical protein
MTRTGDSDNALEVDISNNSDYLVAHIEFREALRLLTHLHNGIGGSSWWRSY